MTNKVQQAIEEFEETGSLTLYEPCDCEPNGVRHNNGGNYHEIVHLRKVGEVVMAQFDSTGLRNEEPEWEERDDWRRIIENRADYLQ